MRIRFWSVGRVLIGPDGIIPAVDASPESQSWAAFLSEFPQAHLLQAEAWGTLKASFGWAAARLQESDCGAQVLFRRLAPGLTLAYVPKGPLGAWLPKLLPALEDLCRKKGAFALKVEPDGEDDRQLSENLRVHRFVPSPHEIQPRRTMIVDLTVPEDEILARMHPKTRYNIRLATRKGVTVRPWEDAAAFGEMVQRTAKRGGFGAHLPAYYERAYELFYPLGECELLLAEYAGNPLAAIMVFARGDRSWYLYGASSSIERNRMPTYLLQWEGLRWARNRGCKSYDLWGVPDEELEALESQFDARVDGLWGVYRFKRGFGGRLVRSIGAWDRPYNRLAYLAYRTYLYAAAGQR